MLTLAFLIVPFTCYVPQTETQLLCVLPFFGFFTLGHSFGLRDLFSGVVSQSPAGDRFGNLF